MILPRTLTCIIWEGDGNRLPGPRHHEDNRLNHRVWQIFSECDAALRDLIAASGGSDSDKTFGSPSLNEYATDWGRSYHYYLPEDRALRAERLRLILGYISEARRAVPKAKWTLRLNRAHPEPDIDLRWDPTGLLLSDALLRASAFADFFIECCAMNKTAVPSFMRERFHAQCGQLREGRAGY